MYKYKDLTRLTRIGIGALFIYMALNTLAEGGDFYVNVLLGRPVYQAIVGPIGLLTIANFVALVVASILVCCWIYRANANAHTIDRGLTITPGWAVGWYFVPVVNLWKPFQGMKKTWLASKVGSNLGAGEATNLLNWWWGLWLLSSFTGNLAPQLSSSAPQLSAEIGLVDCIATIPLTLILTRIMTQIRNAHRVARHTEIFA